LRIIRAFPRKTNLTPTDDLSRYPDPSPKRKKGYPGGYEFPVLTDEADEIQISVSWVEDIQKAERMAKAWEYVAPVKMGGPAFDDYGGDFVPGMFLKFGPVITSRGCPVGCTHCWAWKREGLEIRELPIMDGFDVLDNNLLACSEPHQREVFQMLGRQIEPAKFTGGLEAARLKRWHVEQLASMRLQSAFFAYDEPADLEPLMEASKMLREAEISREKLRCYVLIGYAGDTLESAEKRCQAVWDMNMIPFAMLWSDGKTEQSREWKDFRRTWILPAIIRKRMKERANQ